MRKRRAAARQGEVTLAFTSCHKTQLDMDMNGDEAQETSQEIQGNGGEHVEPNTNGGGDSGMADHGAEDDREEDGDRPVVELFVKV